MFWSGRPSVGIVVGNYYYEEQEFDEKGSNNYYFTEWAGQTKRLSGYANFQAQNNRTDAPLVTIVNAMTFLEHQMITQNSLVGNFYSVKGASNSNSVRNGFIPVAEELSKKLGKKSDEEILWNYKRLRRWVLIKKKIE